MQLPGFSPEIVLHIWEFWLTQTLITSIVSTLLFVLFVFIYKFLKKRNPKNKFVNIVEMIVEWVTKFFEEAGEWLPNYAKVYVLFLFFYILWNNLFGLIGDLFSVVIPSLHHYFRPVATDVTFNAILAVFWVVGAIVYGFANNWIHFIERYLPYKGIGIVTVDKWWKAPLKLFDIALWLFIWILEFIWEFVKMLSLSLRLFWNIFAWVVLLTLVVSATITFIKVPLIAPLLVMFMETLVSCVQALVFSLLVLVYFKMAEHGH